MTLRLGAVFFALLAVSAEIHAATERYDYDSQGRLVRRVDSQNQSTDYSYDAAGNIIQVQGGNAAQAPAVTGITPSAVRRNQAVQVSATGAGLTNITVRGSDPGVQVSSVVSSAAAVSFRLSVSGSVPLGAQQLVFENAAGTAQAAVNVLPALAFNFEPSPISVAPDGIARKFSLVFADPFPDTQTFTLSTLLPSVAKTKTSQVTLAAGQTSLDFGVIGVAIGTTRLQVSGSGFSEPLEALISVAAGAANRMNTSVPVGISKGVPWSTSPNNVMVSGGVGIAKGTPWSTSPNNMAVSGAVGIAKGVPWAQSANAGPVIAPLVGIVKP